MFMEAVESGFGEMKLVTKASWETGVAVGKILAGNLGCVEEAEETDGFAKVGDLGGPEYLPSVIGAAVGFGVVHGLAEEAVKVFV